MSLVIKHFADRLEGQNFFSLSGELDIATAPELKNSIENVYSVDKKDVVLDLENLEFIDSTGLGAIVSLNKKLAPEHKIILTAAKPHVSKIFKITGLYDRFFI